MSDDGRGHRDRFRIVSGRTMPIESDSVTSYVQGMRGRVFDLPPRYLDAAARAFVWQHPRGVFRRALLYLLVSDRFVRSRHALLRNMNEDDARRFSNDWDHDRVRGSGRTVVQ